MKIDRITGKDNPVLRKLLRASRKDELVIVEGPKLLREAIAAGFPILNVILLKEGIVEHRSTLEQCSISGSRIISTSSQLLSRLSDTVSNQGIIGFCEPKYAEFPQLHDEQGGPLVVLDALQDPGNVGAILRSALAFGALGIVFLPGCANPFSSKAVRASAGACFRIPLFKCSQEQLLLYLSESDVTAYALEQQGNSIVWEAELKQSCVIIVGNEGSGINPILQNSIKQSLSIPVDPRLESLNAAVAASVVLYEIARRGRRGE